MTRSLTSRASQLTWAADTARHAPSIFNTQPWRWHVGDVSLELWADPTRQLAVVDPDRRLLTISCGTALHHARTALEAGGDTVRIDRLPDPSQPDLLARIVVRNTANPGAHQARFAAIALRHSDRRPFTEERVTPTSLNRLRAAAEEEGAHLHFLGPEDVAVLASAASHAASLETADADYRRELRHWTDGPRRTGDGVPAETAPNATTRHVPLRAFQLDDADDTADPTAADRGATYAILWGDSDEPIDWIRAGEALSAVMLDATVEGLALSPMSNVVEVTGTRSILRGLIACLGDPYLALRIGHPQPGRPANTPRRHGSDVIDDTTRAASQ